MRWLLAGWVVLSACSSIGVRPRPAIVEAGAEPRCTSSFWMPTADVALAAGLVGLSSWASRKAAEDVREAQDRGEDEPPDSPYRMLTSAALFAAAALIVDGAHGVQQIRACRRVEMWLAVVEPPPAAGQPGRACLPVFGGGGHCNPGYHCQRGMCMRAPAPPSLVAPDTASHRACAAEMGALSAPMSDRAWQERWHRLARDCQDRLRDSCAADIHTWQQASPDERARLEADTRPACLRLARLRAD